MRLAETTNMQFDLTRITKDKNRLTPECVDFSRERIIDVVKKRRLQTVT